MLSKLEFFEPGDQERETPADREALRKALERLLGVSGRKASVTPAAGGTLGICFRAEIAGDRRFLKTHLAGAQARANLAKEMDILLRLYGEAVVLARLEVRIADETRLCMLMAALAPLPAPMTAEEAAAMVRDYSERFAGYRPVNPASARDFEDYLAHGRRAIVALADRRLIGSRTAGQLEQLLAFLHNKLDALPRTLCHGDFGPKNIMSDGTRPIAIDWEDAFWGVAGYDYLYWLTFMDNRPFLRSASFGRTDLEPTIERAILALVVLLKSFLSVRSGAFLGNMVPIETRIAEVLDL